MPLQVYDIMFLIIQRPAWKLHKTAASAIAGVNSRTIRDAAVLLIKVAYYKVRSIRIAKMLPDRC